MQQDPKPYWHPLSNASPDAINEVSQYSNEADLSLVCTQLSYTHTPREQRRIVDEWCDFFVSPRKVRRLWIHSRLPQRLFDCICHQSTLECFYIKWASLDSLQGVARLKALTHLGLGSPGPLSSLESLGQLQAIKDLSLSSCFKATDYSFLKKLRNLETLTIQGDGVASMKKACVDSLQPLSSLSNLKWLSLIHVSVLDDSYASISALQSLQHLDLPHSVLRQGLPRWTEALPNLVSGNAAKGEA